MALRLPDPIARGDDLLGRAVWPLLAVLSGVGIGAALSGSTATMLATIGVLVAFPVLLRSPILLCSVAPGAMFFTYRLDLGPVDLSYADAVVVFGALVALRWAPWHSPWLRQLLLYFGGYLLLLVPSLLANPSTRAIVEWFHRIEIVVGALIIGSALAVAGKARATLRVYTAISAVYAVAAIVEAVTSDFTPAYPLGIHKNGAAMLFAAAILVLHLCGPIVGPRRVVVPAELLLFGGILACQGRAAAATLIGLMLLIALRSRRGRRGIVPLLGAVALGAMVVVTVIALANDDSGSAKFNSYNSRISTYEAALDVWRDDPITGVGIRFWNDPKVPSKGEPHNVIVSALGESGVIGAVAIVVFNAGIVAMLWKRRDPLGQAGLYLTIAHLVDAMAGIYWVAGTGTISWLILGLAVGVDVRSHEREPQPA
jgi:O-antigen ligase